MSMQALTDAVAAAVGIPKTSARTAVDTVFARLVSDLVDGGTFAVVGVGVFSAKDVPAREGRDPRTHEPIEIPAQRKVKFKPAKALRDALNAGQ